METAINLPSDSKEIHHHQHFLKCLGVNKPSGPAVKPAYKPSSHTPEHGQKIVRVSPLSTLGKRRRDSLTGVRTGLKIAAFF